MRRLNERGSRLMLQQPDDEQMQQAARLFEWGLALNPRCSLCHQNLGAWPAHCPIIHPIVLLFTRPNGQPLTWLHELYASDAAVYRCPPHAPLIGDVHLRMEQPELAESSLRAQISLLPRDSDAYFSLGMALRQQEKLRKHPPSLHSSRLC